MSIEHSTITDPDRHEPKDISAAATGTVYVSNGAGSGVWSPITSSAFGGIGITDSATTVAVTTAVDSTFQTDSDYVTLDTPITFDVIAQEGVTVSGNKFTITQAGTYFLSGYISFSSDTNSTTIAVTYRINGTIQPAPLRTLNVFLGSTGNVQTLNGSEMAVGLTANDTLEIAVAADKTCNLNPRHMSFSLFLVKGA